MVNATVDNEAISITLQHNESTTVPAGEVWKVTITAGGMLDSTSTSSRVMNLAIGGITAYSANSGTEEAVEIVVTGGDTLSVWANDGRASNGVHIGGFVVN